MARRDAIRALKGPAAAGRRRRVSPGGGFTLVEVTLALLLTALAVGTLYGLVAVATESWKRNTNLCRLSFETGFFCDSVSRDLRGALWLQSQGAPPFVGAADSMSFLCVAQRPGETAWPATHTRYSLEKTDGHAWGSVRVETTPNAGGKTLCEKTSSYVLVDRVYDFKLRYYKDREWQEQWDEEGLPSAVEITAAIESEDGRARRPFRIVVDVPCGVS